MNPLEFNFYNLTDKYVDYLHSFDTRVEEHKKDGYPKPYIGIVVPISDFEYFIPISSPKRKHERITENISFIKITENTTLKAVININNMIPVPASEYTVMKFSDFSDSHQDLLSKEYSEVKRLSSKIYRNATNLYNVVTLHPSNNTGLVNICCNFKMLESKSLIYAP